MAMAMELGIFAITARRSSMPDRKTRIGTDWETPVIPARTRIGTG